MPASVFDYFFNIFNTWGFSPRWHCGQWSVFHGWLYILASISIAAAYITIPFTLIYFLKKKPDTLFPRVLWLFASFIFLCGTTHVLDALMFWWPAYRFTAVVLIITAVVSWITIFVLFKVLPVALSLKSSSTLEKEINEREKAEQLLKISEELLQNAMDYAPIGNAIATVDGCLLKVNPALCNILGFSKNELINLKLETIVHPDDLTTSKTLWQRLIEKEIQTYQIEKRFFHKDKSVVWVQFNASLILDKSNEPLYGLFQIQNISKRRKMELDLRRAKKEAEQANIAKNQFLANISHEIRTPLNGMLGLTDVVLDTKLNDEQRECLSMSLASGKALLKLINNVLDFSKIETKKLELQLNAFDIRQEVREVVFLFEQSQSSKALVFETWIDTKIPRMLIGDVFRFRQILNNLVGNACKFTEFGQISVGIELLSRDKPKVELHCWVKDTGIGIASEKQDDVFESFFQVDSSLARKYEGTGLGLSISKELVELMGGKIWLESQQNIGSTFHFTVNVQMGSTEQVFPLRLDEIKHNGGLNFNNANQVVLVVEDNQVNQYLAKRILESEGYSVITANNGAMALSKLQNEKVDLVLMDLNMPEMDGHAATIEIRKTHCSESLPVIALTANANEIEAKNCFKSGMNDYLSKPFLKQDLIYIVGKYFIRQASNKEESIYSYSEMDFEYFCSKFGNELSIACELYEIFHDSYPDILKSILNAISLKDGELLLEAAHNLKGALATFTDRGPYLKAKILEKMGREMKFVDAMKIYHQLKQEILILDVALERRVNKNICAIGMTSLPQ